MFQNYKWTWKRNGKIIFAPTKDTDRRGDQIIEFCDREVEFPVCFYHYRKGGHVVALHGHLQNRLFFKIDIQNFFYSISRNRIAAALHHSLGADVCKMVVGEKPILGRVALRLAYRLQTIPSASQSCSDALAIDGNGGPC